MKFADFLCSDAILSDLQATDRTDVIREITQALVDVGQVAEEEYEGIVQGILKREELGSTGLWSGVAIPHTKHPSVDRVIGMTAVSHHGVDFGSLDGEHVHVFFLLISPTDKVTEHLNALSHISQHLHRVTFRRFLMQAKSADEVRQLLDEADSDATPS